MLSKSLLVVSLASLLAVVSGCGDTIVTPSSDRVIKKEVKVNEDGTSKTKETTIHENSDGTETKTEKKTETK